METPTVEAAASSENELITIAGGVEIEIEHLDGKKETVKVRQIPISKIQAFVFAVSWGNMADAIALYCDQKKEWVDTLTGESGIALAEKGRELNLPFFEAWSKDQAKWKEVMTKDRIAELEKELATAKAESASRKSALESLTNTGSLPSK